MKVVSIVVGLAEGYHQAFLKLDEEANRLGANAIIEKVVDTIYPNLPGIGGADRGPYVVRVITYTPAKPKSDS